MSHIKFKVIEESDARAKHPESIQYFLFTVSIGLSLVTATVVNNIRLLIMWGLLR